jgi:D-alanyl-lipoteichoic acid acyltransferase DltB (MBOAT superfamily)
MGGSRKGPFKTYRNLLITMILGGLWHGANWTFLLWGFFHGALLAVTRAITVRRQSVSHSILSRALSIFLTFHLVCIGWVLFRAENIQIAGTMLQMMFQFPFGSATLFPYFLLCLLLFFAMAVDEYVNIGSYFERFPAPARALIILLALLSLAIFIPAERIAFIYFQF